MFVHVLRVRFSLWHVCTGAAEAIRFGQQKRTRQKQHDKNSQESGGGITKPKRDCMERKVVCVKRRWWRTEEHATFYFIHCLIFLTRFLALVGRMYVCVVSPWVIFSVRLCWCSLVPVALVKRFFRFFLECFSIWSTVSRRSDTGPEKAI